MWYQQRKTGNDTVDMVEHIRYERDDRNWHRVMCNVSTSACHDHVCTDSGIRRVYRRAFWLVHQHEWAITWVIYKQRTVRKSLGSHCLPPPSPSLCLLLPLLPPSASAILHNKYRLPSVTGHPV